MVLLALFTACSDRLATGGAETLAVCPEPTVSASDTVVDGFDIYEYCVAAVTCPARSELDAAGVIAGLRFVAEDEWCEVTGAFKCGLVTKDEGCCYTLDIQVDCPTAD